MGSMRRKKKYNKKVRNATATTFNGIKFKSKLEKFTYQCLRVAGIPFQYEEVRFTIIDKFIYPGESIEKKKNLIFSDIFFETKMVGLEISHIMH